MPPSTQSIAHGRPTSTDLSAWMCDWIEKKLRARAGSVKPNSAFMELGLDSLVAVELSGRLEELVGHPVDASAVWDYPTISALAEALCTQAVDDPIPLSNAAVA